MYGKRPKMQRVLSQNHYPCSWLQNFISIEELEQLKKVISDYFDENTVVEDLSYEYLRLLTYLINSDFLIAPVDVRSQWLEQLTKVYELLEKAFKFCIKQLSMSLDLRDTNPRKRTTTGNFSQIREETDDAPVITTSQCVITEEQLIDARKFFIILALHQKFARGKRGTLVN